MAKCSICGGKLPVFYKMKVADGFICWDCSRLCGNYQITSVSKMKEYWEENNRRMAMFTQTSYLLGDLTIDQNHRLFYFGKELKKVKGMPVVYSFDEVTSYYTERVGQQTVTTTKGGVGRAVVGGTLFGAAGAVVGANTARTETRTTGGYNASMFPLIPMLESVANILSHARLELLLFWIRV